MDSSLFSRIAGYNPATVKEYANQQEFKQDEEDTDFSRVDFTSGIYSESSGKNINLCG